MYEEFFGHFGLERNPFEVSPNPQRFYSTAAHDEAVLQLVFGLEARQGLMVLTGEAGTGKTTILQYFLEWVQQKHGYSTAYVFHTMVSSADLLRLILQDFGIPCESRSKANLRMALGKWLLERHKARDCPVIIIDEAQALRGRMLDELRMLLNLEVGGAKLVQLVLAGQPRLEEKLRWRKLGQLRQRIRCHCTLPAMSAEETAGYIASRLAGAGASDPGIFSAETVQEIFRCAKGIPRVINLVCEHALLAAYADRRASVSCSDVFRVAQQFELNDDGYAEKDPLRSDTFGRLIPFPRLRETGTPKVEEKQAVLEGVVVTAATEPEFLVAEARPDADMAVLEAEPMTTAPVSETAEEATEPLAGVEAEAVGTAAESVGEPEPAMAEPMLMDEVATEPVLASGVILEIIGPQGPETARPVVAEMAVVEAPVEEERVMAAALVVLEAVVESAMITKTAEPTQSVVTSPAAAESGAVAAPVTPKPAVAGAPVMARPVVKKIAKAPKVVKPRPVASPIPKASVVVRARARRPSQWRAVESYWRGVGNSFVRDALQFWLQAMAWLRMPMSARGATRGWRRMVLTASAWLRTPLGSGPTGTPHPRVSPASHRHI